MSDLQGVPALKAGAATECPRPLAGGVIKVVASAIRRAWEEISKNPAMHLPPDTGQPAEDRYTYAITEMLEQMREDPARSVPGFSDEQFGAVIRGGAVANYNHEKLTKQPDLTIRLADRDKYDLGRYIGVFIEAKVVETGASKYANDGVRRFVDGEYAWAMRDGVMLAYQTPPTVQLTTLRSQLRKKAELRTREVEGEVLSEAPMEGVCASSLHERNWHYRDKTQPGDIRIWHLWRLEVPAQLITGAKVARAAKTSKPARTNAKGSSQRKAHK